MSAPTDLDREPPRSVEAEEYLLSCCLLDGGDTLIKSTTAGLAPAAFYLPANSVIFDCLCHLHRTGKPVAIEMLIEELRTTKQLEAVGGVPYLIQVSGRIPTTAQAAYFIDKVRELYLQRELIKTAVGTVERCFDGGASAAELLADFDRLRDNSAFASVTLRERLEVARLNPDAEPPAARELYKLNGAVISTPGNLCTVTGQSKAGKTAFIGAMMASTMGTDGDFLGAGSANPQGWAVLHIDTEQSRRDHWQVVRTALDRAGRKTAPPWFYSYGVAGWTIQERREALEPILRFAKAAHGGVHSVLLDGIGDFCSDPNDSQECFPLIDSLQALAVRFDCGIVEGLHLNPASGDTFKSRGHLGSHAERRSESNLILSKDDSGKTCVFSNGRQRHAPILRADGPCFRWSDSEQRHVTVESIRIEKDTAAAEAARELAREVFAGRGGLPYSQVMAGIKSACKCCDRTADKKFKQLRDYNAIGRSPPNLWTLAA